MPNSRIRPREVHTLADVLGNVLEAAVKEIDRHRANGIQVLALALDSKLYAQFQKEMGGAIQAAGAGPGKVARFHGVAIQEDKALKSPGFSLVLAVRK